MKQFIEKIVLKNQISQKNVTNYIFCFSKEKQKLLRKLRKIIRMAAPDALEGFSYGMPSFKQNGILVFYAAWKHHIGFYPTSTAIRKFRKGLSNFEVSRGTIRFPLDQPLPSGLIKRIVQFRVKENLEKTKKRVDD